MLPSDTRRQREILGQDFGHVFTLLRQDEVSISAGGMRATEHIRIRLIYENAP